MGGDEGLELVMNGDEAQTKNSMRFFVLLARDLVLDSTPVQTKKALFVFFLLSLSLGTMQR